MKESKGRSMKPALVVLVDDQEGFWISESWNLEWPNGKNYSFTILPVPNFRSSDDISQHVEKRHGAMWRRKFQELFVITDSNFDADYAGGSWLLQNMLIHRELRWLRSVIYSEEPKADGLDTGSREHVLLLKKRGQPEDSRIREYFDTGVFPSLEPLWEFLSELTSLRCACKVALTKLGRGELVRCPSVRGYGQPASLGTEKDDVFHDSLLTVGRQKQLFTYESAQYFGTTVRSEFESQLDSAIRLGYWVPVPDLITPTAAWSGVCSFLDPVESIDAGGAIRRLWENIQTGGDRLRLEEHPMAVHADLSARERCWVIQQLSKFVRTAPLESLELGRLLRDALEELEWVLAVCQAVIDTSVWAQKR